MLFDYLTAAGYRVEYTSTGEDGLARIARGHVSAVILDVMLPDIDGFEVCRRCRAASDVPILMLTARGDEMDRVVGLEIGADDYITKPFSPRELLARVRAVLRRRLSVPQPSATLHFGRLEIDSASRQVRLDGTERPLTAYQFDLLRALAQNAGRVVSRDQLMDIVKGQNIESLDRSIDVHISRIRAAIEDDPKQPRRIVTVRGAGYFFARTQDAREALR